MSQARVIRDGILERLPQLEFFRKFKKFGFTRAYQVQPTDLPYVGVYLLPDTGRADGDWNATAPHFIHHCEIGMSVILPNIEADELENALDAAYDVITIGLLADESFMQMGPLSKYNIEGVNHISKTITYGTVGNQNETPIGELQLNMTFVYRFDYPPEILDDLITVHLETVYPSLEEAEKTQQVKIVVEYETEPQE
jgi:hypothetical protein